MSLNILNNPDPQPVKVFTPKRHAWLIVDSAETLQRVMAEFGLEGAVELDEHIDKSDTMEAVQRNSAWAMRVPSELPEPTTLYTLLTPEEKAFVKDTSVGNLNDRVGKVMLDRKYPLALVFLTGECALFIDDQRHLFRTSNTGKGALASMTGIGHYAS